MVTRWCGTVANDFDTPTWHVMAGLRENHAGVCKSVLSVLPHREDMIFKVLYVMIGEKDEQMSSYAPWKNNAINARP